MWSVGLRLIGVVCLVWTLAANANVSDVLQSSILMLLCFAVAHILRELDRLAIHAKKRDAAIARLLQSNSPKKPNVDSDLAPTAPQNWGDFKPRPAEPEKDTGYQQRLAQRWRYAPRKRA